MSHGERSVPTERPQRGTMEGTTSARQETPERLINKATLGRLLLGLETANVLNPITLYLTPGETQGQLAACKDRIGRGMERIGQIAPRIEASETGSAVFLSEERALAILPPFPLQENRLLAGWDTTQLRKILAREYMVGVVLLRLGRYSVGVVRGETLLSSNTDTRYVKGKHSAGGQSQKRFQRIREKQIDNIYQKTCSVVKDQFGPFENQLDYIFLGGERYTLLGFLKRCDYLRGMSSKILARVLNVRQPKRQSLEKSIETIWESRVLSVM